MKEVFQVRLLIVIRTIAMGDLPDIYAQGRGHIYQENLWYKQKHPSSLKKPRRKKIVMKSKVAAMKLLQ